MRPGALRLRKRLLVYALSCAVMFEGLTKLPPGLAPVPPQVFVGRH